jgi:hypothetical protein
MAVAWSGEGVGHATQDLIIRDPVVIMASTPRFMAVGDTAQMLVELANTDGPGGRLQLSIEPSEELVGQRPGDDRRACLRRARGIRLQLTAARDRLRHGHGAAPIADGMSWRRPATFRCAPRRYR